MMVCFCFTRLDEIIQRDFFACGHFICSHVLEHFVLEKTNSGKLCCQKMECPADIHLYAKQNFKYKKTTPFSPSCKFYNRMHNSGGVVFFCPRCMLLYSEAHGRRGWSGWRLLRRVAYATLCLRDTTMDQDVHECRKMGDTHSLCGSWPLRDDRSRDYRSGSCLLGKNHKPTKRDPSNDNIYHPHK